MPRYGVVKGVCGDFLGVFLSPDWLWLDGQLKWHRGWGFPLKQPLLQGLECNSFALEGRGVPAAGQWGGNETGKGDWR